MLDLHLRVTSMQCLIESVLIQTTDSQYYVTDPDVEHIPVEQLLSKVGCSISSTKYCFRLFSGLFGF